MWTRESITMGSASEPKRLASSNFSRKLTPQTIDGTDYLFIESGGFSEKNPPNWQIPLMVMKRD